MSAETNRLRELASKSRRLASDAALDLTTRDSLLAAARQYDVEALKAEANATDGEAKE
jgi:hypothetical protein